MTDTQTILPIKNLSASSIRDFKNCPLLFYYRHVLKLRLPQKQMALVFGGAVHKGIEHYHDNADLQKAIGKFKQTMFAMKTKLLPEEEGEFFNHLTEGDRLLTKYVEAQDYIRGIYGIDPAGTSEIRFSFVPEDPLTGEKLALPIKGFIDRRTNSNQIMEFKTSKKKYKQDDTDLLDQATVYSWQTEQETGLPVKDIVYVILRKGIKKDPIQILRTSRSKEDYSRLFREAKNIIKSIEKGHYPKGCQGFKERFCDCQRYQEALEIL